MSACIPRIRPAGAVCSALVLILISGCADVPTQPTAVPTGLEASLQASAGPVVEQASGSGHFREDGYQRTFTFSARRAIDGSATGSFNVVIRTDAGTRHIRGEVTCLRVIGNEAWVGGRNADGTAIAFRVLDADQDGSGQVDQVSFHYYSPFYGPVFPEFACRSAILLPLNPVDAGNISVQGERLELTTVYENDFETAAGSEWSVGTRSTSPSGETFLGEFSDVEEHGPTLTLSGLPAHRYVRVSLDFYAIRTLDGSDDTYGLDLVTFSEASSGFSYPTTFSGTGGPQAFPGRYPEDEYFDFVGASGVRTLGFVWQGEDGSFPMDATYPVEFTIAHTGQDLTFSTIASGLQDFTDANGLFTDESWGIDNVRVEVIR
jgi:hypothetical protein